MVSRFLYGNSGFGICLLVEYKMNPLILWMHLTFSIGERIAMT
jgi:hypothetical protein